MAYKDEEVVEADDAQQISGGVGELQSFDAYVPKNQKKKPGQMMTFDAYVPKESGPTLIEDVTPPPPGTGPADIRSEARFRNQRLRTMGADDKFPLITEQPPAPAPDFADVTAGSSSLATQPSRFAGRRAANAQIPQTAPPEAEEGGFGIEGALPPPDVAVPPIRHPLDYLDQEKPHEVGLGIEGALPPPDVTPTMTVGQFRAPLRGMTQAISERLGPVGEMETGSIEGTLPEETPKISKGLAGVAKGMALSPLAATEALMTPENFLIMAGMGAAPKALSSALGMYFTKEMTQGALEATPELVDAVKHEEWDKVAYLLPEVFSTAVMALQGASHAARPARGVTTDLKAFKENVKNLFTAANVVENAEAVAPKGQPPVREGKFEVKTDDAAEPFGAAEVPPEPGPIPPAPITEGALPTELAGPGTFPVRDLTRVPPGVKPPPVIEARRPKGAPTFFDIEENWNAQPNLIPPESTLFPPTEGKPRFTRLKEVPKPKPLFTLENVEEVPRESPNRITMEPEPVPETPALAEVPAQPQPALPEAPAPTPVEAPAAPAKPDMFGSKLKVQRGMHGPVDVQFPDTIHADLFSQVGRMRRWTRGEGGRKPEYDRLADMLGIDRKEIGKVASEYRKAVLEAAKAAKEGETITVPRFDEIARPAERVAAPISAEANEAEARLREMEKQAGKPLFSRVPDPWADRKPAIGEKAAATVKEEFEKTYPTRLELPETAEAVENPELRKFFSDNPGNIAGYDVVEKTLYVIRNRVPNAKELTAQIFHEVTHYGLDQGVPREAARKARESIAKSAALRDWAKTERGQMYSQKDRFGLPEFTQNARAEELITTTMEDMVAGRKPMPSTVKHAVSSARNVLREFFPDMKWTESDIAALAIAAERGAADAGKFYTLAAQRGLSKDEADQLINATRASREAAPEWLGDKIKERQELLGPLSGHGANWVPEDLIQHPQLLKELMARATPEQLAAARQDKVIGPAIRQLEKKTGPKVASPEEIEAAYQKVKPEEKMTWEEKQREEQGVTVPAEEVAPPRDVKPSITPELREKALRAKNAADIIRRGLKIGEDVSTVEAGQFLEDFVEKHGGKIDPEDFDAFKRRAYAMGLADAMDQLIRSPKDKEFYRKDFKKAMTIAKNLDIGLDSPTKLAVFRAMIAGSSFGRNPILNTETALGIWDQYRKKGKFPLTKADGSAWGGSPDFEVTAKKLNKILEMTGGEEGLVKWLDADHSLKELRTYASSLGGKASEMLPGWFIIGPKGGPFALNLGGLEKYLTIDRWQVRFGNRVLGHLLKKNPVTGEMEIINSPRGHGERGVHREFMDKVAGKLGLTVAQTQSLLWHFEKDLYSALGVPEERGSYGDAFEEIARRVGREDAIPVERAEEAGEGAAALEPGESRPGGEGRNDVRPSRRRPEGFYSEVGKAVAEYPGDPSKNPDQFLAWLKKRPGVKPNEIEWTNVEKLTRFATSKQQIVDVLNDTYPLISERVSGTETDAAHAAAVEAYQKAVDRFREASTERAKRPEGDKEAFEKYLVASNEKALAKIALNNAPEKTQYEAYILPGPASDYKETRLNMPHLEGEGYSSSHFPEKNIVVHNRTTERTYADGKTGTNIEEIQSDLNQEGRKKGFRPREDTTEEFRRLEAEYARAVRDSKNEMGNLTPEQAEAAQKRAFDLYSEMNRLNRIENVAAPENPFQKSEDWALLGFKSALRDAVANGHDRVTWTTGEQQADRYSLAKHIDTLGYFKAGDGTYDILAGKDGKRVLEKRMIPEDELEGLVGKEIARKIVAGEKTGVERRNTSLIKGNTADTYDSYNVISGLDLKVGGEGMAGFYDKILPAVVSKYIKKWGGKVGEAEIPGATGGAGLGDSERVHSVEITPAMREAVSREGQPMFSRKTPPLPADVLSTLAASTLDVDPRNRKAWEKAAVRKWGTRVKKHLDQLHEEAMGMYPERSGMGMEQFTETAQKMIDAGAGTGRGLTPIGGGEVSQAVDQLMGPPPVRGRNLAMEAAREFRSDPDKRAELVERLSDPEFNDTLDSVTQEAAKQEMVEMSKKATGNPAIGKRIAMMVRNYRKARTETARLLGEGGLNMDSPVDSFRMGILELIYGKAEYAENLSEAALDAQARLKGMKFSRVVPPTPPDTLDPNIYDLMTTVGADVLARGKKRPDEFRDEMVKRIGPNVEKYLRTVRIGAEDKLPKAPKTTKPVSEDVRVQKMLRFLTDKGFDNLTGWSDKEIENLIKDKRRFQELVTHLSTYDAGVYRKYIEFWRNGLLGGPTTVAANALGNMAHLMIEYLAIKPASALVGTIARREGRRLGDLAPAYKEFPLAMKEAWRNAYEAFVGEFDVDYTGDLKNEPIKQLHDIVSKKRFGPAIGGKVGRFVRLPQRGQGAVDNLFGTFAANVEALANAREQARSEGLTGQERARRTNEIFNDRGSEAWQKANAEAQRLMFREELDKVGKIGSKFRSALPGGEVAAPFWATPYNIGKVGAKMTPGVGHLITVLERMDKGNKTFREAATERWTSEEIVRPFMGPVVAAALYGIVSALVAKDDKKGAITPMELYEREHTAEWNTKQSVRPQGTIETSRGRISYNRADPASKLLSAAAAFHEARKSGKDPEEAALMAAANYLKQVTVTDAIKSIVEILDVAVTKSWKDAAHIVQRNAASFSPFSSFRRALAGAQEEVAPETRVWGASKPGEEGETKTSRAWRRTARGAAPEIAPTLPPRVGVAGGETRKVGTFAEKFLSPFKTVAFEEGPGSELLKNIIDYNEKGKEDPYWPGPLTAALTPPSEEGPGKKKFFTEQERHDFEQAVGKLWVEKVQEQIPEAVEPGHVLTPPEIKAIHKLRNDASREVRRSLIE